MNRHKQVLAIGRAVLGRGCDYSEPNTLTRRIKYYNMRATEERITALRVALDANGFTAVQVKAVNSFYNGAIICHASITLLVPIAWKDE